MSAETLLPLPLLGLAWQTGLLHTWRGSVEFLGVLWPEALLPSCVGGIPGILVWLGPQDPLQLHLYKKGELISPGCWEGLTCHHGHRDQLCPWTVGQSRSVGSSCPWVPGTQLSLAQMRSCDRATGCWATGKLHQPSQLEPPAGIWEEEKRGRQESAKRQGMPETCMSPFPLCTSSFKAYLKLHPRYFWKQGKFITHLKMKK